MPEESSRRKGWHPDPFGFYQERYYYLDDKPGRLVRNADRVEFYDDVPEWAKDEDAQEVPPARLRPPPAPVPVIAAAVETTPPPAPEPWTTPASDPGGEVGLAAAAATAAAASTPAETGTPDYFPDEPIRWRTRAATRVTSTRLPSWANVSWIRRAPRPSRRTWYIIGAAGLALVLGAVIFAVLPGPDHTPASAQLTPTTNPQLKVPGNFLNGARATAHTDPPPSTTSTTAAAGTTSTTAAPAPVATTQSWSVTGSFGASALSLTAVTCPTTTQCYAVGETTFKTGMVLVSADGGSTWTQYNVPTGVGTLSAIACSTGSSCVAVGGTSVITTTDSGTSWAPKTLGQNALTMATCPSATECIVGGSDAPVQSGCDSGHTYATTDSGLSWESTPTHCFVPSSISCTSPSRCVVVGTHTSGTSQNGEILTSANGGDSWQSRYVLSNANTQLNSVSCPNARLCVAVGNSPTQSILRSSNGGSSWIKADPGVSVAQSYFLAVSCGAAQDCSAGGSAGPVATTDGGTMWAAVAGSSLTKVTGISCSSATTCVGVAIAGNTPTTIKLA
jgi:photosystem II stability/assembly factor-like uncharacterized protein